MPPSTRLCKIGFIPAYLEYTEKQESPEMFHLWSIISTVAMALGRKCYVKRGFFTCYPNQYIILVSDSARCRKTVSADMAVALYRAAAIGDVFQGKLTTRSLSQHLGMQTLEKGESPCYIYSPELGRLLGMDSYTTGLMTALTDYYGCPSVDTVLTATQGKDDPKNIFINILGCTVPNWLSMMPSDMVEGGFSSRTIFVVQSIPRAPNARPVVTKAMEILYANMIQDLRQIAEISGEYVITEDAEAYYDSWYNAAYTRIDEHDPRMKAYYARKGEHVFKVAMVLAASESQKRILEPFHITNALTFLNHIEQHMHLAFRGVSFSDSTKHMDRILSQIKEGGDKIERSALLRKNRFYLDMSELDKVIETLVESNMIRKQLKNGKWWYYNLDNQLDRF